MPSYRDQFAIANGYVNQRLVDPVLPSVQPPEPPAPEPAVDPDGWRGPVGGKRTGAGHRGWAGLAADVQGYASALLSQFPGLKFTSGFRDPEHNRRVNGVPTSRHLKGRAIDAVGSARDMYEAAAWAKRNGARYVKVHNVGSGQHLHVEW